MNYVAQYSVPVDLPCFAGHFPGHPLVPGALVLAWVEHYFCSKSGFFINEVKSIKFHKPVLPGAELEFDFKLDTCKRSFKFTVYLVTSSTRAIAATGACSYSENSV